MASIRITSLLLLTFVTVGLCALQASGATIDTIETKTGGTYLDFEFNTAGNDGEFTRGGFTATTTGSGWGFPDASLAAGGGSGINGTGMDSQEGYSPFSTTISGLTGAPQYEVWVLGLGDAWGGWGFTWRLGSTATKEVIFGTEYGSVDVLDDGNDSLYAHSIGTFTPSAGELTFTFTKGGDRTLLDGVSIVPVPEPSTLALLVGALMLTALRPWKRTR